MLVFQTAEELGIAEKIKEHPDEFYPYYSCDVRCPDGIFQYEHPDKCMVELFLLEGIWQDRIQKELEEYRASRPPFDRAAVELAMRDVRTEIVGCYENEWEYAYSLRYTDTDGNVQDFHESSLEEIRERIIWHEETKDHPAWHEWMALNRRHPIEWYDGDVKTEYTLYDAKRSYSDEAHQLHIKEADAESVAVRAEMANDEIRKKEDVYPIVYDFRTTADSPVWFAMGAALELSAIELRNLIVLYEIAVFGDELDRKAARERIYTMLGMDRWKEDLDRREAKKHLFQKLAEPDRVFNSNRFHDYLHDFIKVRKVMNQAQMAELVGYSASQFGRYLNGSMKAIPKELALRMAITMELDEEQFKDFVGSAGFTFPTDEVDYVIEKCLKSGRHSYDDVRKALYENEKTAWFVNEKRWK